MVLRWVSLLWLLITTTATSASPSLSPFPSPSPDEFRGVLRRLDSLEQQVTLQQDQLDRERNQWHRDNSALRDKLSVLETDVQDLKAENKELKKGAEEMQQALTAENVGLKSVLDAVREKLAVLLESKPSAEQLSKGFGGKKMGYHSDHESSYGHVFEQQSRPNSLDEISGGHSLKKQQSLPSSPSQSGLGWRARDERNESEVHVSARADDQGPLDVVVSQMSQRLTEVTADVQTLKTVNDQQDQAIQQAQGSSYTRWGHSSCPADAELVYAGVVGGSSHVRSGAAATALCLTTDPVLQDAPPSTTFTELYGGEYETYDSHQDNDPSCAVCRSLRSSTIMVPGTNVCSSGWTLEYTGFLMAGLYAHAAGTEFICVDTALEARLGSDHNDNGFLLYFTEAVCGGSLPCPPYAGHKIVTCAVCSK